MKKKQTKKTQISVHKSNNDKTHNLGTSNSEIHLKSRRRVIPSRNKNMSGFIPDLHRSEIYSGYDPEHDPELMHSLIEQIHQDKIYAAPNYKPYSLLCIIRKIFMVLLGIAILVILGILLYNKITV